MIFEFTSYINPPTKNEKSTISVWSKRAGRKVPMVNPAYKQVWELIHNELYISKFNMSKTAFKLLQPKKRAELEKNLFGGKVVVSMWNGFKRMDAGNFWDELVDRLQGVAYKNDRQIKEYHVYVDETSAKEYFKIIVEEML
jgi:Holliday junction resolvase RusA-like endonuclease